MNKKEKFVKKYVKKGKSADYGLKRYRNKIIIFTICIILMLSGFTLILHFSPKTNHINTTGYYNYINLKTVFLFSYFSISPIHI